MSRHGNRQGHWIGAAILIVVGVIGLLANFGLVDRETLHQLWKLWPVIPLAIGIGMLMRRNQSVQDRSPPETRKD
jgi:cadmium resistance protein CadD (predicted permease)